MEAGSQKLKLKLKLEAGARGKLWRGREDEVSGGAFLYLGDLPVPGLELAGRYRKGWRWRAGGTEGGTRQVRLIMV